jgi:transposase-like protein
VEDKLTEEKQTLHPYGMLWIEIQGSCLLALRVSKARGINSAVAVFKEAINNAYGNKPQQILTDSWRTYREGISQNFTDVDHITKCGINKSHADNNRVERLNGTMRERTKVTRAWKKHKTPLAEGQRIQYICQVSYGIRRTDTRNESWDCD